MFIRVYGRLCTCLKKTPEEIDQVEWNRALDLLDYWQEYPPEHELLRAWVGYEPPKKALPPVHPQQPFQQSSPEEVIEFVQRVRALGG